MVSKAVITAILVLFSYLLISSTCTSVHNLTPLNSNGSYLSTFNVVTTSATDCGFSTPEPVLNSEKSRGSRVVKLPLKRRISDKLDRKQLVVESTFRDLNRIHTFRRRILENKNQNAAAVSNNHRQLLQEQHSVENPAEPDAAVSNNHRQLLQEQHSVENPAEPDAAVSNNHRQLLQEQHSAEVPDVIPARLVGSLKSGVSLGSGEYFIDVYLGTPPKHFLLILDTGSDLNWIQCVPCHDCFEQDGPHYNPNLSTSYQNISCNDPRCDLVSPPDPAPPCRGSDTNQQSCPYFYWYGDSSNTTGDFAQETFTVNLTSSDGNSEFKKVENVMFGCGHWNRGLFHGASGLLGLGRGPLSFSSQLKSLYGHSFSYCLVDRNSDPSVSSKLIFGEDKELLAHPELSFTTLLNKKDDPVDTFYYVDIKAVSVGGETLNIPKETWGFTNEGGGTIIDSGSTLSYFIEPAYEIIKEAFTMQIRKLNKYSLVTDFLVLKPCYNVSGTKNDLELPSFKIHFSDGAEWNFPIQNYFIWVDQEVVCLALMPSKTSPFSIIGNYQQQNFHILYDTEKSRLGFAPTKCADV